jgi:hypothetical protein
MISDRDRFRSYKFRFELRFTVFEQHRDDFSQIAAQFFQSGALRMSPGESGHVTNKQFRLWIALYNRGECSHDEIVPATILSRKPTSELAKRMSNCLNVPSFHRFPPRGMVPALMA